MSNEVQTVTVPHLGSSIIGYKFGKPYDASLPTLVLVNSFTTSVEQYRPQFADETLSSTANLLALEPYGHGQTRASYEQFTYWDSAIANLQVLDALGIPDAFVLGTSQGGWIAARMAMLAPGTVKGIMPLGTSMDFESQRSRDLGCWDGISFCTPAIDALAGSVDNDWVIPVELVDAVLKEGLGEDVPAEERAFWHATHQKNYTGDAGRSDSGSAPSTCAIGTACTPGWTASDVRSCGCTAPRTPCTRWPTPRTRSPGSSILPTLSCGLSRTASIS